MTTPTSTRVKKAMGGDFRLSVEPAMWRLTEWNPGTGRTLLASGPDTDFLSGSTCLLDMVAKHFQKPRDELRALIATLSIMTTGFELRRPGFRPGWSRRALIDAQSSYSRVRTDCLTTIADCVARLQANGWPVDTLSLTTKIDAEFPA